MKSRFHQYLRAERHTGLFLLLWAVLSAAAAIVAYALWPGKLLQAVALTATILSLLQLWSGIGRIRQASFLHRKYGALVEVAPPSFAAQEIPRLEAEEQAALRRRRIELALLILGLCFALLGGLRFPGGFLLGTGLALCIQASVLLVVTLMAQWRDGLYRHELERVENP